MMISVQEGEALRIRGDVVLSVSSAAGAEPRWEIVVTRDGGISFRRVRRGFARRLARAVLAWWLRMHRSSAAARRFMQARRETAQALRLAELDARSLRDIGLEPYQGSAIADRVEAYRRRLGSLM